MKRLVIPTIIALTVIVVIVLATSSKSAQYVVEKSSEHQQSSTVVSDEMRFGLPETVDLENAGDTYQLEPIDESNEEASFSYKSSQPDLFPVDENGIITYLQTDSQASGFGDVYVIRKALDNTPAQVIEVFVHCKP